MLNCKESALDLGNRSVNFATVDDVISMTSVHAVVNKETLNQRIEDGEKINFTEDSIVLEYNKNLYAIGSYGLSRNIKDAVRNFSDDKYTLDSEKAKMLAIISLMYPNEIEIEIETLVTSLPPEIYTEAHKEAICRELRGTYPFYIYDNNQPMSRKISIKNVYCVEQCGVVVSNYGKEFDKEHNTIRSTIDLEDYFMKYIVGIDIGGKTSEVYVYQGIKDSKTGEYKLSREDQFPIKKGTANIYENISSEVFNKDYKPEELEFLLKTEKTIPYRGKMVSVDEASNYKRFAEEQSQEIIKSLRPYLNRIWDVKLFGGGMIQPAVQKEFKKAFKDYNVKISKQPQTDNVKAQLIVAVMINNALEAQKMKEQV